MNENSLVYNPALKERTKILIGLSMAVIFSGGFYGLDFLNRIRHAEGKLFYEVSHLCHEIPLIAEWIWVYLSYFPICFLPLLLKKVRKNSEIFKRVALGFSIQFLIAFVIFLLFPTKMVQPSFVVDSFSGQVLAWLHQADKGFNAFPSLHVSNIFFVAGLIGRLKGQVWGIVLSSVTAIVSLSTILVGQHCFPDVLTGMALGVLSFKVSFSEPIEHLLSRNAPRYIFCQLKNLWNLWIKSNPKLWEEQYQSGYWEFLRSIDQRPRYYTIQGLINEYFPDKFDLLDVGCGEGILFEFVKDKVGLYEGIDCSTSAIEYCQANISYNGNTAFHTSTFEDFSPTRKYDIIIFNEILYYFPVKLATKVFEIARSYLRNEKSIIIVSMNSNLKSQWIFKKLDSTHQPKQSIRVENTFTGSYWTVKTYFPNGQKISANPLVTSTKNTVWKRITQWFLAILGVASTIGMIQKIGWESIASSVFSIGWLYAFGLFLFYSLAQLSFCFGWYWSLGYWRKILGLRGILFPFLAGDALNCSIPSANTAGEPLRVAMLKDKVSIEDATVSVTIYKFTDFLSLTLFLGFGLGISWLNLSFPSYWYWSGLIIFLGMVGTALLLIRLQSKGLYSKMFKIIGKIISFKGFVAIQEKARNIDENVRRFCRERPTEFILSLLFNFLGWFGGVIEAYICLYLMALPAKWSYALAIETFSLFINNITFFVPARLGVVEGSRAIIFTALGLPTSSGIAYGIIRRTRELAWIALGYTILATNWHKVVHSGVTDRSLTTAEL